MKRILSIILMLALILPSVTGILSSIQVRAAEYSEDDISRMRTEANTYENISKKVDTNVFDWKNSDRLILLNAQDGANGMGHSGLLLLDNKNRGLFFSYYPIDSSLPAALYCDGDVRMKYLSQQDIRDFWTTGNIDDAVSSARPEETITDGGYNRGIIKNLYNPGESVYEKMLNIFSNPGKYMLMGHQCDDTALSVFCETELEFLYIWGSTFTNPAPNVTYNHLVSISDNERYNILPDFLINQRLSGNLTSPGEYSNQHAMAFARAAACNIDFPSEFALSSEGVMPDGRKYKKYYFKDQDVFANENIITSPGDLSTRYLICVGDVYVEEMYLLFAKAGSDVNGGQHDEIYKRVTLDADIVQLPVVPSLPLSPKNPIEIINGIYYIWSYRLDYSGGSMATIGYNVCNAVGGYCTAADEAIDDDYIYWDAGENRILNKDQWREEIHYNERFSLNDDHNLPQNIPDAIKQGFEKLPSDEAKYHQLNPDLNEFDYGSCIKFVHKDGREAIYRVDTYSKDYDNDISKNRASSTLLTLESYPAIGPTFNYSPNDSAGSIAWWKLLKRAASFVGSKISANSIAHYYFDMLPYYCWGNTPDSSIHTHVIEIDEEVQSSCKSYGLSEGSHCAVCGEVLTPQKFTTLSEHKYVNGVCSVCGVEEVVRYTVIVLDTSSTSKFYWNNSFIYEADTAINYVKDASKKFVDTLSKDNAKNHIAVVSFNKTAEVVSEFTTDIASIKGKISDLDTYSETRDISAGLKAANDLLSSITDEDAVKNVVLCTTGMTNEGDYNYDGAFDNSVVGNTWVRRDNNVKLYAYANVAIATADELKQQANLYVLGLFQTMEGMPEKAKSVVDLFRLTAKRIAGSEDMFYDILDTNNIAFKFGEVVEDITDIDTDGDGLYDSWELYGVDTDSDGVIDLRLDLMGADPTVPDIFVEVDWMVNQKKTLGTITIQKEQSLAPPAAAMYLVYESFKAKGINLHIDAGPTSVDYVTGKQWGNLSGGNVLPYIDLLNLDGTEKGSLSEWANHAEAYFSINRRNVFKYCMFINQFQYHYFDNKENKWVTSNKTISGISNNIPGQYFIVANQKWIRDTGNTGVAGTFMHELGHTLGLSHGGFDDEGNNNHDQYKPNYLSIMNYLFQTTGLVGTSEVNYSEYDLPDLNENSLNEKDGVDPKGQTAGTGLGTKIAKELGKKFPNPIIPAAKIGIDFNSSNKIENGTVSSDINNDGKKTVLTSSTDWDHLIFNGNNVGSKAQVIDIQGSAFGEDNCPFIETFTLEEALKNDVLTPAGTGVLEDLGPYNLFTGFKNQNVYLRVSNPTATETKYTLTLSESAVTEAKTIEVTVPGSVDTISYVDVTIPIINSDVEGTYQIYVSMVSDLGVTSDIYIPISIQSITAEELTELYETLSEYESEIPYNILEEYENALEDCAVKGHVKGDNWIIIKEPDVGIAGEKGNVCEECGEVIETVAIDPLSEEKDKGEETEKDDKAESDGKKDSYTDNLPSFAVIIVFFAIVAVLLIGTVVVLIIVLKRRSK
ncbi:MAG: VWA domain-containing protein [Clostridia bacterium]|nr:VWA domain-containing protein [Clostridia bacterium]